jgi:phage/plasmid-associated DNA primase
MQELALVYDEELPLLHGKIVYSVSSDGAWKKENETWTAEDTEAHRLACERMDREEELIFRAFTKMAEHEQKLVKEALLAVYDTTALEKYELVEILKTPHEQQLAEFHIERETVRKFYKLKAAERLFIQLN